LKSTSTSTSREVNDELTAAAELELQLAEHPAELSQNWNARPPAGILKHGIQELQTHDVSDKDDEDDIDDGNDWTLKLSKKKMKRAKVAFRLPGERVNPIAKPKTAIGPNADAKFAKDLMALEEKRRHKERGSTGSAPVPVVAHTTRHDIRPIDALTFDKANTVASVGGQAAIPETRKNWRFMELLVDSGAVDNVGDPRAFPEYKLRESDGSRNGLHYLAANNGKIKNEGEINLTCRSSEGIPFKLKMQGAGVSRPILSVIRLTENGKDVIFKKDGGIIRDTKTGVTTTFRRKHGIYVMGTWVKTGPENTGNPDTGFARRT